jgi:hypothetical protein
VNGTVGVFAGRIGALTRRRRAPRGVEIATGTIVIGLTARLAVERDD